MDKSTIYVITGTTMLVVLFLVSLALSFAQWRSQVRHQGVVDGQIIALRNRLASNKVSMEGLQTSNTTLVARVLLLETVVRAKHDLNYLKEAV